MYTVANKRLVKASISEKNLEFNGYLINYLLKGCIDSSDYYPIAQYQKRTTFPCVLGLSIALLYLTRIVFYAFKGFYLIIHWAIKTVKE